MYKRQVADRGNAGANFVADVEGEDLAEDGFAKIAVYVSAADAGVKRLCDDLTRQGILNRQLARLNAFRRGQKNLLHQFHMYLRCG